MLLPALKAKADAFNLFLIEATMRPNFAGFNGTAGLACAYFAALCLLLASEIPHKSDGLRQTSPFSRHGFVVPSRALQ
jgi:hypothetical protein